MLFTCISGHSGELVNACGNIDQFLAIAVVQPSRSARNQGHDKQGEIWMSLIVEVFIKESFSDDSQGRLKIFMCLAALLCELSC